MSDENENPSPMEGEREDLFSFPEVADLEEFGLVPSLAADAPLEEAEGDSVPEATAPAEPEIAVAAGKANPPVPESVTNLDEDLFGFDEVFSMDDDPFLNGTLTSDGKPTNPLPEPAAQLDPVAVPEPEPVAAAAAAAPEQAPAPAPIEASTDAPAAAPAEAQAAAAAPQEAPQAAPLATPTASPLAPPQASPQASAEAAPSALPVPQAVPQHTSQHQHDRFSDHETAPGTPRSSSMGQPAMARDRGPRILLPEDVPYSMGGDHGKLIWALVVCFLLVNTGIFMLAQQASTNVNKSISEATGLLAEALAQRGGLAPSNYGSAPATYGSAPATLSPSVSHTVEITQPAPTLPQADIQPKREASPMPDAAQTPPAAQLPRAAQMPPSTPMPDAAPRVESRREPLPVPTEPWVNPRDYSGTHELAVGSSKALIAEGRFEDARRLLNHVLANQDRVPLAPSLREEIDYLIPLTYYEQGRSIAPEEDQ